MDPPTKKYRDPAFLNKVDYLTQKIRDRKPGCESVVIKGRECHPNYNKECRKETDACDKLVGVYHSIDTAIQPYITLAYKDFKSKTKKLDRELLNLNYDELEEILEQTQFSIRLRKFHRAECVVFICRDKGHDTRIEILELLEQVIINRLNTILEEQRSDLFKRLERGEITVDEYYDLSSEIPADKIPEAIIIPPMTKITAAEYWLGQFIKRNPFMTMRVENFEDEIRVTMDDTRYGGEYIGISPLVLDKHGNHDPEMAYRSLYRNIIMKHGSEAQRKATKSWYTSPSRFTVKLLNPELKEPLYRASYVDLLSYYGFGPTPELALEDLVTNIKLELPL